MKQVELSVKTENKIGQSVSLMGFKNKQFDMHCIAHRLADQDKRDRDAGHRGLCTVQV